MFAPFLSGKLPYLRFMRIMFFQVRDFAPKLECWNVELMAKFVLMKNNDEIPVIKKPTIPTFHFSIIP
jgi:hypothetical protein